MKELIITHEELLGVVQDFVDNEIEYFDLSTEAVETTAEHEPDGNRYFKQGDTITMTVKFKINAIT